MLVYINGLHNIIYQKILDWLISLNAENDCFKRLFHNVWITAWSIKLLSLSKLHQYTREYVQ